MGGQRKGNAHLKDRLDYEKKEKNSGEPPWLSFPPSSPPCDFLSKAPGAATPVVCTSDCTPVWPVQTAGRCTPPTGAVGVQWWLAGLLSHEVKDHFNLLSVGKVIPNDTHPWLSTVLLHVVWVGCSSYVSIAKEALGSGKISTHTPIERGSLIKHFVPPGRYRIWSEKKSCLSL